MGPAEACGRLNDSQGRAGPLGSDVLASGVDPVRFHPAPGGALMVTVVHLTEHLQRLGRDDEVHALILAGPAR